MVINEENKTCELVGKDCYFVTIYSYIIGVSKSVMEGNFRFDQNVLTELYTSEGLTRLRMLALMRNGIIFKPQLCIQELSDVRGSIVRHPVISNELMQNARLVRDVDVGGLSLPELHKRLAEAIREELVCGDALRYFPNEDSIRNGLLSFLSTNEKQLQAALHKGRFVAPRDLPFQCYQGVTMPAYISMFGSDRRLLEALSSTGMGTGTPRTIYALPEMMFDYSGGSPVETIHNWADGNPVTFIVDVENFSTSSGLSILEEYINCFKQCKVVLCSHDKYTAGECSQLALAACTSLSAKYPSFVTQVLRPRILDNKSCMDVVVCAQAINAYLTDPTSAIVLCSSDSDFSGVLSVIPTQDLCVLAPRDCISNVYVDYLSKAGVKLVAFRGEGRQHIRELVSKFIGEFYVDCTEDLKEYASTLGVTTQGFKREFIYMITTKYEPYWDYEAERLTFVRKTEK